MDVGDIGSMDFQGVDNASGNSIPVAVEGTYRESFVDPYDMKVDPYISYQTPQVINDNQSSGGNSWFGLAEKALNIAGKINFNTLGKSKNSLVNALPTRQNTDGLGAAKTYRDYNQIKNSDSSFTTLIVIAVISIIAIFGFSTLARR